MVDDFENTNHNIVYQTPLSPLDAQVMLNRILSLKWDDLSSAQKVESDLYVCLQQFDNKAEYLILMAEVQLLLGKVERALAFAYKIWENGGELSLPFRLLYGHILSVLNLKDMAQEIFNPVLDDISSLNEKFFAPLINFAFAHGRRELLLLVAAHASQDVFEAVQNFVAFYDAQKFWKAFAAFQQIIFAKCAHNLLDFEVSLDMRKSYCVVNIHLFVNANALTLQDAINADVDDYCVKNNLINYDNLYINVSAKAQHKPLENILLPVL